MVPTENNALIFEKKIKDLDKKQITVQSNDSRDEIPESQ